MSRETRMLLIGLVIGVIITLVIMHYQKSPEQVASHSGSTAINGKTRPVAEVQIGMTKFEDANLARA